MQSDEERIFTVTNQIDTFCLILLFLMAFNSSIYFNYFS